MKTKVCAKCKEEKDVSEFSSFTKNLDKLHSYCRPCNKETMYESKIRRGVKRWERNGFKTEEDEFNWCLNHYAQIFDMPQLLKHRTNTGSIQRWYRGEL